MGTNGILAAERCGRCERLMKTGAASFFTEEYICPECAVAEEEQIARLRLRGIDPATLAGCGCLPPDEGEEERPGSRPGAR